MTLSRLPPSRPPPARGFSLLEVLVAMAIVALLAAIAIPQYQRQLQRSRREDAMHALLGVANAQEQYFMRVAPRSYTTDLAQLRVGLPQRGGVYTSRDGRYEISVEACGGATIATCFLIAASAPATSTQYRDTACRRMTLDSRGARGPATGNCW